MSISFFSRSIYKYHDMQQNICFLAALFFLVYACADPIQVVEETNEVGVTIKQYMLNTATQQKQGKYTEYDENGKLLEEANFRNDTLEGIRKLYFPDGQVQYEEHYQAGLYQGSYRAFFEDGQLQSEGKYEQNALQGEWLGYYTNGQLKERLQFKDNNENGPFTEWYENGKLKAEGAYLEGDNEHGLLQLYDEQGELERKMECDRGRCTTVWKRDTEE